MEHLAPTGTHLRHTPPPPLPELEHGWPGLLACLLVVLLAASMLLLLSQLAAGLLWLLGLCGIEDAELLAEELVEICARIILGPWLPVVRLLRTLWLLLLAADVKAWGWLHRR